MRKAWMLARIVEELSSLIDLWSILEAATNLLVRLTVLRNYQQLEVVVWVLHQKALQSSKDLRL
jgi:hypothetical protein